MQYAVLKPYTCGISFKTTPSPVFFTFASYNSPFQPPPPPPPPPPSHVRRVMNNLENSKLSLQRTRGIATRFQVSHHLLIVKCIFLSFVATLGETRDHTHTQKKTPIFLNQISSHHIPLSSMQIILVPYCCLFCVLSNDMLYFSIGTFS